MVTLWQILPVPLGTIEWFPCCGSSGYIATLEPLPLPHWSKNLGGARTRRCKFIGRWRLRRTRELPGTDWLPASLTVLTRVEYIENVDLENRLRDLYDIIFEE